MRNLDNQVVESSWTGTSGNSKRKGSPRHGQLSSYLQDHSIGQNMVTLKTIGGSCRALQLWHTRQRPALDMNTWEEPWRMHPCGKSQASVVCLKRLRKL